jgi:hypothetical protein
MDGGHDLATTYCFAHSVIRFCVSSACPWMLIQLMAGNHDIRCVFHMSARVQKIDRFRKSLPQWKSITGSCFHLLFANPRVILSSTTVSGWQTQ